MRISCGFFFASSKMSKFLISFNIGIICWSLTLSNLTFPLLPASSNNLHILILTSSTPSSFCEITRSSPSSWMLALTHHSCCHHGRWTVTIWCQHWKWGILSRTNFVLCLSTTSFIRGGSQYMRVVSCPGSATFSRDPGHFILGGS